MNLKSLIPAGRDRSVAASPFVSLQREIDRLFEDFTRGFPTLCRQRRYRVGAEHGRERNRHGN